MGCCRAFLKILLYSTVAFGAVLVYFHVECQKEEEEKSRTKFNDEYLPDKTNCEAVLPFTKTEIDLFELYIGPEFILQAITPCAFIKLMIFIRHQLYGNNMEIFDDKTESRTVSILDARKHNPGSFEQTGFTLIQLDEEPKTTNWRPGSEDISLFQKQLEPHLMKMYPQTKRIQWMTNLVRGGNHFGDQPAAPAPHLDYHQNDTEREIFYDSYDLPVPFGDNKNEPNVLMGVFDNEDEKLGVMLGVWKPIQPDQICDLPLAIMDARTFEPENQILYYLHINFLFMTFHNLNGAISYNPNQKWYYYSQQTTKEVLVFHQYTKGKWRANPHTAFKNKNCPKDTESRISAEIRVALYF